MSSPGMPIGWADAMLASFERMAVTEANQRAALFADIGMCLGLVAIAVARQDTHPALAVLAFVSGLFSFSLVE